MPRPITDLQKTFPARAAAAREPVRRIMTVTAGARKGHPVLLEPCDRGLRLARQDVDEPHIGRLVRALPDVLGVEVGGVVVADGRLDTTLRLGRVAGLERALRHEPDARPGPFRGERRGQS